MYPINEVVLPPGNIVFATLKSSELVFRIHCNHIPSEWYGLRVLKGVSDDFSFLALSLSPISLSILSPYLSSVPLPPASPRPLRSQHLKVPKAGGGGKEKVSLALAQKDPQSFQGVPWAVRFAVRVPTGLRGPSSPAGR